MTISVCMAVYNGEKYIEEQLRSILAQLHEEDEIILSDDGSTDRTLAIIASINDLRIQLIRGGFKSPVFNYENAIRHAKGDIIVLADQDDLWLPGRIENILPLHQKYALVVCKSKVIDANGNLIRESFFYDENPIKKSLLLNLYKNPYLGCCMSFRKELLAYVLPFPKKIAMHDIWIGLNAHLHGKCVYYKKEALVAYRRYGQNVTNDLNSSSFPISYRVAFRCYFLRWAIWRYFFKTK